MRTRASLLLALVFLLVGCSGEDSDMGATSAQPRAGMTPSPLPINFNMPTTVEDTAKVIGCELGNATTSGSVTVHPCLNSDSDTSLYQLTGTRKQAHGQLRMVLSDESTWFVVADLSGAIAVGGSDDEEVAKARTALGISVSQERPRPRTQPGDPMPNRNEFN